jgi:hypothetical protein
MRFFEFNQEDVGVDKFVMILRNYIGRAASKKASAKLNWNALGKISASNGFEFGADYETFKAMYDASPTLQSMVKNFNDNGLELNVPGAPEEKKPDGTKDSQAEIDKMAASAAPQQLAQQTATPQA